MKVILNCHVDGSQVPAWSRRRPLALFPFLGQTVLEQALTALAAEGVKHIRLVAVDRVGDIQAVVGRGEAWGLEVEYATDLDSTAVADGVRVLALDHLPHWPQQALWRSYCDTHTAQHVLMPVLARQRLGMREIRPGVFVGLRSQIAADACLLGRCWIGTNVYIGPRVLIAPGSIIEDGCYVDEGAEIVGSVVGPGTYVGAFTELRDSFAWGRELLQLNTGSMTEINDPFLLSEVRRTPGGFSGWRGAFRRLFGRAELALPWGQLSRVVGQVS